MKKEVARKSSAGQLKLQGAMLTYKYRKFRNPLERMAHIVNKEGLHLVDAYNSKNFSKIRIKRAVKDVRQGRLVSEIGTNGVVIGEKEQTVLDEIKTESLSGASLTIKKMSELACGNMPTSSKPLHTHICQPLDRGIFTVLKSEMSSQCESPSSSSSAAKTTALVEAIQQLIHSELSPSVIKRAFKCSCVLKDSSGPILMKLPQLSTNPLPSHENRFDFYG
ncbi:uncharacterized protein MONOS_13313 [Monocercomonoides exilis]|uniref:uncharacterized protein n=1 Tax=Monocercomonoides exilis TaxID=2049356 RepID=UPI00355A1902|nr:hypothetical protein MONOS_13313 [Monocercomonoides exilis]|eukprot:MONOS_13313.1-p1 / transcript=MONOS_13313.1 / gene=MONOS_13313 / organism=Monocercomonoides_exilis_PA203 / gene_product=unspecified product / transcript_product=unspecified product / location=Mono_scaffold00807:5269-6606(-) / protein_length=221 / sequence_SO=supercontig / SO=protein_coding / is_pseudo=false